MIYNIVMIGYKLVVVGSDKIEFGYCNFDVLYLMKVVIVDMLYEDVNFYVLVFFILLYIVVKYENVMIDYVLLSNKFLKYK